MQQTILCILGSFSFPTPQLSLSPESASSVLYKYMFLPEHINVCIFPFGEHFPSATLKLLPAMIATHESKNPTHGMGV